MQVMDVQCVQALTSGLQLHFTLVECNSMKVLKGGLGSKRKSFNAA